MNAPTLPAAAAALTAAVAARMRTTADTDPATPTLVPTTEGPREPADLLDYAARLLGEPEPYAQLARVRAEQVTLADKLHATEDLLGALEQELHDLRGFAVDAHELLTHAANQLTRFQEQEWDYDRAAWLERARPLLAANPYQPVAHLPGQGHQRRLVDADRLRVAAFTIQAADALQVAARVGVPELLGQAAEGYERARRLYAQHAATDTRQPVAPVLIDTTLDHDHDGDVPADTAPAAAVGAR